MTTVQVRGTFNLKSEVQHIHASYRLLDRNERLFVCLTIESL